MNKIMALSTSLDSINALIRVNNGLGRKPVRILKEQRGRDAMRNSASSEIKSFQDAHNSATSVSETNNYVKTSTFAQHSSLVK